MSSNEKKSPEDLKTLNMWDREYKTMFNKKFSNRKPYVAPDPMKAFSYIPGVIRKLSVKEGQKVKKGDPMLVLESMKMMNIVKVPVDAKVKKILIAIGEVIPKNHLMIEFEE
jgi:biotin carboxyl carrier protein